MSSFMPMSSSVAVVPSHNHSNNPNHHHHHHNNDQSVNNGSSQQQQQQQQQSYGSSAQAAQAAAHAHAQQAHQAQAQAHAQAAAAASLLSNFPYGLNMNMNMNMPTNYGLLPSFLSSYSLQNHHLLSPGSASPGQTTGPTSSSSMSSPLSTSYPMNMFIPSSGLHSFVSLSPSNPPSPAVSTISSVSSSPGTPVSLVTPPTTPTQAVSGSSHNTTLFVPMNGYGKAPSSRFSSSTASGFSSSSGTGGSVSSKSNKSHRTSISTGANGGVPTPNHTSHSSRHSPTHSNSSNNNNNNNNTTTNANNNSHNRRVSSAVSKNQTRKLQRVEQENRRRAKIRDLFQELGLLCSLQDGVRISILQAAIQKLGAQQQQRAAKSTKTEAKEKTLSAVELSSTSTPTAGMSLVDLYGTLGPASQTIIATSRILLDKHLQAEVASAFSALSAGGVKLESNSIFGVCATCPAFVPPSMALSMPLPSLPTLSIASHASPMMLSAASIACDLFRCIISLDGIVLECNERLRAALAGSFVLTSNTAGSAIAALPNPCPSFRGVSLYTLVHDDKDLQMLFGVIKKLIEQSMQLAHFTIRLAPRKLHRSQPHGDRSNQSDNGGSADVSDASVSSEGEDGDAECDSEDDDNGSASDGPTCSRRRRHRTATATATATGRPRSLSASGPQSKPATSSSSSSLLTLNMSCWLIKTTVGQPLYLDCVGELC